MLLLLVLGLAGALSLCPFYNEKFICIFLFAFRGYFRIEGHEKEIFLLYTALGEEGEGERISRANEGILDTGKLMI